MADIYIIDKDGNRYDVELYPGIELCLVKHGKWLHHKETQRFHEHWSCSVCAHDVIENPIFKNSITGENLDFLYCPFCGARMDGE